MEKSIGAITDVFNSKGRDGRFGWRARTGFMIIKNISNSYSQLFNYLRKNSEKKVNYRGSSLNSEHARDNFGGIEGHTVNIWGD